MKDRKHYEERLAEVASYKRLLLGKMVEYSLLAREKDGAKQYGICIACEGQRESCYLNDDLFSSVAFFQKLVEGGVFPYSLCEVVEDFWAEQKISM